jgi:hypothetical protein
MDREGSVVVGEVIELSVRSWDRTKQEERK